MKTSFDKNGKFRDSWSFMYDFDGKRPKVFNSSDIVIASVNDSSPLAQDSARLIAAAPRLFNALVGLMESTGTLVADPYECDLTDEERAALAECRAAIAAVRGENENF